MALLCFASIRKCREYEPPSDLSFLTGGSGTLRQIRFSCREYLNRALMLISHRISNSSRFEYSFATELPIIPLDYTPVAHQNESLMLVVVPSGSTNVADVRSLRNRLQFTQRYSLLRPLVELPIREASLIDWGTATGYFASLEVS